MIIYLSLLAGAIVLGILLCRNKAGKIAYCSIMGAALFIVAALRRSVGDDYNNYGWMYIRYMSTPVDEIGFERTEKGYTMINKILADYVAEYQIIFIVMALFFAAAVAICAYKYCKRPWLGFTFFLTFGVYFNTLNFIRQMVAGFIMMYAMKYIRKNQFGRYLILVLFATCFHRSALIMIPFYFILRIKMNYISLGVMSGVVILFLIFSWDILDFAGNFMQAYKTYSLRTNIHLTTSVDPTFMIFVGIMFAAAFIFRKRLTEKDPFNNVLINCLFFTFVFEVLGVKHSILSRLGVFFVIPAAMLLMPKLLEVVVEWSREKAKGDRKRVTLAAAASISAFAVVNFTLYGFLLAENYNGVLPYRTMFENFETEASQQ